MWSQNWGEMIWSGITPTPVPLLGPMGLLLLGALLGIAGTIAMRHTRAKSYAGILGAAICLVPITAWAAVTLPFSFTNGTLADATEVNANFSALVAAVEANEARLDAIDQMFLTTSACPTGYTAVENGYIKLGRSGLTLIAQAQTLAVPGHGHSIGSLSADSGGGHQHLYNDYYWSDTGSDPAYATPGGDDVGERRQTTRFTVAQNAHPHAVSGTAGNTGGPNGDADLAATGDLAHVLLRLCVKN